MQIHIIGGGIIGLCSAWYLNKEGFDVTVIDRTDLCSGTSHGNAGMIVPSHFVPMASPGVVAQGIRWMFNAKSPFYVKPRLSLNLLQWLWKFYRSSTEKHVSACVQTLLEYNQWSKELYGEFAKLPEFNFDFERKGLLMLYQTAHQEQEEKELAERAHELGVSAEIISESGLKTLEPSIEINARGGIYFPGDAHLQPGYFIRDLIVALKQRGVEFLLNNEVEGFGTDGDRIQSLNLSGQTVSIDHVLIAAGTWSGKLVQMLKGSLPLEPGKGYSVTLSEPEAIPEIPSILTEAKVAVTPMGSSLRIGGTLELGQLSLQINHKRVSGILESMPRYYPQIQTEQLKRQEIWQGFRPCSPDGMPYVDTGIIYQNLTIATGHGMMGMSLGPATGKLVAELIADRKSSLDLSKMKVGR